MTSEQAAKLERDFERNGYVTGIRVRTSAEAAAARAEFDAFEAQEGREKCQIGLMDRHLDTRFVWNLATDPRLLDAVEAVMGPDILLLATHFFCKYPTTASPDAPPHWDDDRKQKNAKAERFVAWHQDVTYWGLEPPFALTAWYAVDDADVENGCMRVIPATHDAIREHATSGKEGNLLSINQEVPVTPEEEDRAADLCLKAGEISIHHGVLIHGSNPNRSSRRRCGMTVRFIPPSVKVVGANSVNRPWTPILVRGEDRYGHYDLLNKPFSVTSQ